MLLALTQQFIVDIILKEIKMKKKSISNRVKYTFVMVIILISAGFVFSIYTKRYYNKKF